MWSCPDNMPKYYPGLRDILPDRRPQGRVICLSDLGNIMYYSSLLYFVYVSVVIFGTVIFWHITWVIFWHITWTIRHSIIMKLIWSCPGNMLIYYPGLIDILPSPAVFGRVIYSATVTTLLHSIISVYNSW
jgi:hypothetical protein